MIKTRNGILATIVTRLGPFRPWIGRALGEWRILLGTLGLLAIIWGFAELADEVMQGDTHAFDEWLLLAMRHPQNSADPLGPEWFEEALRDVTALGGLAVLVMIIVATTGFLLLQRKTRAALLVVLATSSGIILSSLLKNEFDRPRPSLVPHEAAIYTTSFPSGHSLMAAVTYLTLGALVARTQHQRSVKIYVLSLAMIVTLLVGLSRVYLGVHWMTDVLAGWTAGAGWALLIWLAAYALQSARKVEPD